MADFQTTIVNHNENSWGPIGDAQTLSDLPYFTAFSKNEKVGRAADWSSNNQYNKNRYNRDKGDGSAAGTIFNYYHYDDESSFQLVDFSKPTPKFPRFGRKYQPRTNQQFQEHKSRNQGRQFDKKSKWGNKFTTSYRHNRYQDSQRVKSPSIVTETTWKILESFDFTTLKKLPGDVDPKARDLKKFGELLNYNKLYDLSSSAAEKPLERTTRTFFNVTSSVDPVIKELAKSTDVNVFGTDSVISHLMATTRSVNPWHLYINKVDGKIFLDKDGDAFDFLTVNETSQDPPSNENKESINSAFQLSQEATFINQNFSQQVLVRDGEKEVLGEKNPFQSEGEEVASVGYKYRQFDLDDKIKLVVRCEMDAIEKKPDGTVEYLTLKALNPQNDYRSAGSDWRRKIDAQRSGVLATELKNNSCKITKWAAQSLLCDATVIKIGFVGRVNNKDNMNHTIVGIQEFKTNEFAALINLNMRKSWAVIKKVLASVLPLNDGKYILVRDHASNSLKLYLIPPTQPEQSKDE